jgi:hypothetical protein
MTIFIPKICKISGVPPRWGRRGFKEGGRPMTMEICWLDDLAKAQETARKINKPILLDFYNPQ